MHSSVNASTEDHTCRRTTSVPVCALRLHCLVASCASSARAAPLDSMPFGHRQPVAKASAALCRVCADETAAAGRGTSARRQQTLMIGVDRRVVPCKWSTHNAALSHCKHCTELGTCRRAEISNNASSTSLPASANFPPVINIP
jgi:hypothetical protein